ncbi:4a-hydroxytetrahydrobiopterin dehydratase [Parasynechococcus sp.]|jgi:pterin-4a-carbinolamine dehydratase|uniref:4a-hydroxytetrahydrobiopterin dehydratase n=1 Tax=Parasynechococcus sp. TaxID=3101203 RepID=UPI0037038FDB
MDQWQERKRPVCLERRFEFDSYDATRDFLDRLGEHSEATQRFPDISFGRTYVNITLRPDDEAAALSDVDRAFAAEIDALI